MLNIDPTGPLVLRSAHRTWCDAADFRRRRQRFKRFTYGDQWNDPVVTSDGRTITEGQYATEHGKRPLSNNLIRRLVKCVVGRFRDSAFPADSAPLSDVALANSIEELDSRALEEFLISGCTVQRIEHNPRRFGCNVRIDNVSPDRFFVNAINDPRGLDALIVGMLHDYTPAQIILEFADNDYTRARDLRHHFSHIASAGSSILGIDSSPEFFIAPDGKCRVIEVWTLETVETFRCHDPLNATLRTISPDQLDDIENENTQRRSKSLPEIRIHWNVNTRWVGRWLAPDGATLRRRVSTLPGGTHPFAFRLYPLTDGEIHSLVEDVIDQQIYVNRLITLIDHCISVSAKGALLFPVEQKLPGMDWAEIARMWAAPDSLIPYAGNADSTEPHQVVSSAADNSARDLLTLQMKMFEEVSGVTGALMGKSSGNNVGAQRFESEIHNATIAICDIIRSFNDFRRHRDSMCMVNRG